MKEFDASACVLHASFFYQTKTLSFLGSQIETLSSCCITADHKYTLEIELKT